MHDGRRSDLTEQIPPVYRDGQDQLSISSAASIQSGFSVSEFEIGTVLCDRFQAGRKTAPWVQLPLPHPDP